MKIYKHIIKFIFGIISVFTIVALSLKHDSLSGSHNTISNYENAHLNHFSENIGEDHLKNDNNKARLLQRELKSLVGFASELNIQVYEGIEYGFFCIASDLIKKIRIQDNYANEDQVNKIKEIATVLFEDWRLYFINIMKIRSVHHDKLLCYISQNRDLYPCLSSTIDVTYKLLKKNHGKTRCWSDWKIFYKDIIQRYLRSVCRERIKSRSNKIYYDCCKESASHFVENLHLENISIHSIFSFDNMKNCVNPDPNKKSTKLRIANSNSVGFSCTDFPIVYKEYNAIKDCKNEIVISDWEKNEIEQILEKAENNCNVKTSVYFFDYKTIIGFLFSLLVSLLLFYFRF